jgi:acyl phosphate:glycerol-3-phosphate acyltransferase
MMLWLKILAVSFLPAYLIGSVPYGYLFGRMKGLDIRRYGSGNIGATNVWRVMGRKWGMLTFFLDFLKVPISAIVMKALYHFSVIGSNDERVMTAVALLVFLGAVLGHNYPIWLGFRGGKGIATSAGGLAWLMGVQVFLIIVAIWTVTFILFRYVSLSSLLAAASVPPIIWIFYPNNGLLIGFSFFLCLMAVWTHRSNIRRLLEGKEHQFSRKKKGSAPEHGGGI